MVSPYISLHRRFYYLLTASRSWNKLYYFPYKQVATCEPVVVCHHPLKAVIWESACSQKCQGANPVLNFIFCTVLLFPDAEKASCAFWALTAHWYLRYPINTQPMRVRHRSRGWGGDGTLLVWGKHFAQVMGSGGEPCLWCAASLLWRHNVTLANLVWGCLSLAPLQLQ